MNAKLYILRIKKQLKQPRVFLRKPGENQVKTRFSLGFRILRIKKQLKHPGAFLRKPGENQAKTRRKPNTENTHIYRLVLLGHFSIVK
jgi:hypothetical protein